MIIGTIGGDMSALSTVTSKGQVTIPIEIRRYLGLEPSDRVTFVVSAAGDVVLRSTRATIERHRGSVPALAGDATQNFDEQLRDAMEEFADRSIRELEGR